MPLSGHEAGAVRDRPAARPTWHAERHNTTWDGLGRRKVRYVLPAHRGGGIQLRGGPSTGRGRITDGHLAVTGETCEMAVPPHRLARQPADANHADREPNQEDKGTCQVERGRHRF